MKKKKRKQKPFKVEFPAPIPVRVTEYPLFGRVRTYDQYSDGRVENVVTTSLWQTLKELFIGDV